jgi:hypothetical protein
VRRRNPGGGVRAALAAEYRYMASLYDTAADGAFLRFAARIDAGEPVTVHGYEVGIPGCNHVRVEPDGSVIHLERGASA